MSDFDRMADCFNEHFCSVATRLSESLPISDINPLTYVSRNVLSFDLDPVTSDEVIGIIGALKNSKSHIDTISVKILKLSKDYLGHPFSH